MKHLFVSVLTLSFALALPASAQTSSNEGVTDNAPAIAQPELISDAEAAPQRRVKRVVEPVPVPPLEDLYYQAASKTPSGFAVPRFVSLKYSRVNGRTGPSRDHPIAWQYQRRGLPLLIVAETEMWRKVRDITGDEAWVRKSGLSGERHAIALSDIALYSKPREGSSLVAMTDRDALLKLEECVENGWCRVRGENGLKGWTARYNLWGAQRLN